MSIKTTNIKPGDYRLTIACPTNNQSVALDFCVDLQAKKRDIDDSFQFPIGLSYASATMTLSQGGVSKYVCGPIPCLNPVCLPFIDNGHNSIAPGIYDLFISITPLGGTPGDHSVKEIDINISGTKCCKA